jgi:hypothetical protein
LLGDSNRGHPYTARHRRNTKKKGYRGKEGRYKKVKEVQTGKNLIVSESGLGRSQLCGLKKF